MSDDWLQRTIVEAQRSVADWPEWMKRVAYMEGAPHSERGGSPPKPLTNKK